MILNTCESSRKIHGVADAIPLLERCAVRYVLQFFDLAKVSNGL
jgi:hypothetical protein